MWPPRPRRRSSGTARRSSRTPARNSSNVDAVWSSKIASNVPSTSAVAVQRSASERRLREALVDVVHDRPVARLADIDDDIVAARDLDRLLRTANGIDSPANR